MDYRECGIYDPKGDAEDKVDGFLQPGQSLQEIWVKGHWIEEGCIDVYFEPIATCLSLTVVMEKGQMGEVPWVKAEYDDGTTKVYNVALLQGYSLKNGEDNGQ